MVFSAVIVRASREYHSDTFMTTNVSLASPCTAPWHATHKSSSRCSTDVDIERVLAPTPGAESVRVRLERVVHSDAGSVIEMDKFGGLDGVERGEARR